MLCMLQKTWFGCWWNGGRTWIQAKCQSKGLNSFYWYVNHIWVKDFKNGPSKICGRQPLKKYADHITSNFFKGCLPQVLLGSFLKTWHISGIYPSNFDVRYTAQNTQSSNWNSIFIKICFKAYWRWTCIQNKLAYKVYSVLSYLFLLQM